MHSLISSRPTPRHAPCRPPRPPGHGRSVLALESLESRCCPSGVSFAPDSPIAVGDGPRSVAVGDFNGDGLQDLAVANSLTNSISILLGDGDGGFADQADIPVGGAPYSIAVGDFNGDDKPDLAVANYFDGTVSVLLSQENGGFKEPADFLVGINPFSIAVGDFNGDGHQDLATANSGSDSVSVLLGNGGGGFTAVDSVSVGPNPISVAAGDFNGDGRDDLAVANIDIITLIGSVSVLLSDREGGFTLTPLLDGGPTSIAVEDFNGDGFQDLAVTNIVIDEDTFIGTVRVLLRDGEGGFEERANLPVGDGPVFVTVGDFNDDGKWDLAVANYESATVSVLLGAGAGGFAPAVHVPAGDGPYSIAVGDFNGDGLADLAVANLDSGTVSVLLNTTPSVSTPAEQAAALQAQVDALQTAETLNEGQATALKAKLVLRDDDDDAGRVRAFIQQVTAWVHAGILSPEQAEELLVPARRLLASVTRR